MTEDPSSSPSPSPSSTSRDSAASDPSAAPHTAAWPGLGRVVIGSSIVAVVTHLVVFLPAKAVDLLAGREKIYETIGASCFLLAAFFFFRAFRAVSLPESPSPGQPSGVRRAAAWRRVAYACLAFLLFVACGEELSWGQHFLGFETPESIKEINAQDEVNLHNLWLVDSYSKDGGKKSGWRALLNSNRLFDYFMITLLWLIPFAHRFLLPLRPWIDRFGGPVVPGVLGLPLLVNFLSSAAVEILVVKGDPILHLAVSETREMHYALMCAVAALWLLRRERRR